MGIADLDGQCDVTGCTCPIAARTSGVVGYNALHAKAEEFDLGRSLHCLIPMFCPPRIIWLLLAL